MIWSPDSNVLFGPHPDLTNYFCCNGIIPGFSQSGGMGLMSAQWMVEGESQYDMFAWDVARFGDWADKAFTRARVGDQYAKRFAIHFPNEERDAGRPVRTRPAHALQAALGGVFGLNYGWEHVQWFADHPGAKDTNGFTRQNWFEPVGRECRMLRENGGDYRYFEFRQISRIWGAGGGMAQRRFCQHHAQGRGPVLPYSADRCAWGDRWRFHRHTAR